MSEFRQVTWPQGLRRMRKAEKAQRDAAEMLREQRQYPQALAALDDAAALRRNVTYLARLYLRAGRRAVIRSGS